MRGILFLLCLSVVIASSCTVDLALGVLVQGDTADRCLYRVDFADNTVDRLWTINVVVAPQDERKVSMSVMNAAYDVVQTVGSDGDTERITLCRRASQGVLERVFWIQTVGQPNVVFNLTVLALQRLRLAPDKPSSFTIGGEPSFYYAQMAAHENQPVSVEVTSPTLDIPFQLQVSWLGCPDITIMDAYHQVLTFTTAGRMLVLPEQLQPPPDVIYIGVRPLPLYLYSSLLSTSPNSTLRNAIEKNITLTFSYAPAFVSAPVAVPYWAAALTFLLVALLFATGASSLIVRSGVESLRRDLDVDDSTATAGESPSDRWTRGRAKVILWMVALSGVFYLIPSFQTASSEASSILSSGNHDRCYYNDLCMFPLWTAGPYSFLWWATNNILSNSGYLIVGLMLWGWVMLAKRHCAGQRTIFHVLMLPSDYTLMYCLCVAIFFEGLMSATYHICPNRLIFTVDTAFMFVGSIVAALEVYRKWFRTLPHPAFPATMLALMMLFNYTGTIVDLWELDNEIGTNPYTAHVVLWPVSFMLLWNICVILIAVRHRQRMHWMPLAIVCSLCCLLGCVPLLSIWLPVDRTNLLLSCAIGTTLVNLFGFVLGTLHRVDCSTRIARAFMVAAVLGTAIPAVFFFEASPSNKALSPWRSRQLNANCVFYDSHDVWHMLSALALGWTGFLLLHCGEMRDFILPSHETRPTEDTPLIF